MLTLLIPVRTTLKFGGGPNVYALPLSEEVLFKFAQRMRNAKLFSLDESFDCFQFRDTDGKWISADPDTAWYEDVVSFGETKIVDVDFENLEPCENFSLRLCRIYKSVSLAFLVYEDGGTDEWFTWEAVGWNRLMQEISECKKDGCHEMSNCES